MSGLFGSAILETVLGLVFVYLFLAIIVSVINELIAQMFALRAKTLEAGLANLLQTDARKVTGHSSLVQRLYLHPLSRGLSSTSGTKKPSYIPSRQFAVALLDIVAPDARPGAIDYWDQFDAALGNLTDTQVSGALGSLARNADGDVQVLQKNIEHWFEDAMDRVSGWYQRDIRKIILALSFLVSLLMNADSLNMARSLWVNPMLRAGVVAVTQGYAASNPGAISSTQTTPAPLSARLSEVSHELDAIRSPGLPLGWGSIPLGTDIPREIVGLLLTTLAVSVGAPFWFDLLNMFINFRSTGKPPGRI